MDFPIVPDCGRMSGCRGVMVVGFASAKVMGMGVAGHRSGFRQMETHTTASTDSISFGWT